MLLVYSESNQGYERLKEVEKYSDLLNGIDNEMSLDEDKVYEFVQYLWLKVISTSSQKRTPFSFTNVLNCLGLKQKDSPTIL